METRPIEIHSCEVCGNEHLRSLLDLGLHPMCDDLVKIGDTRVCREYPIEILFCERCFTAHQRFQIPKEQLFPRTYHYRSRHTADVLNGMKELAAATERELGDMDGKKVLDIGCNDGSLLSIFKKRGAQTYGIEPTEAAQDATGHTIIVDYVTDQVARDFVRDYGHPDVITFTNVFAHIENLIEVLAALRTLSSPETIIVIENHYFGSIIEKNQFDTFYHEHPRTYSHTSFTYIADSLGMSVVGVEFPERYGGNIRIILRAKGAVDRREHPVELERQEQSFGEGLSYLSKQIEKWRTKKRVELTREIEQHGKLAAKAFPGRAAILIKLLGLDETHISAVYEKPVSSKVGHYVPGTRIPILADDEFSATKMHGETLLNLAWHIAPEITSYMEGRGFTGKIVHIISADDFLAHP